MGTAPQPKKTLLTGQVPVAERYEVVQKIVKAIAVHRDADRLFQAWIGELRAVLDLCAIGIAYRDEPASNTRWWLVDSDDHLFPCATPALWEDASWNSVYESQQPLAVNLADSTGFFVDAEDDFAKREIRSVCLLPLSTAHRKLGLLLCASDCLHYFSDDMIDFLSLAADQIAIGIDNALHCAASQSVENRLERETTKLKLLLEVNNAIVSDLELTNLLTEISPCLRRLIQVDAVALILPDSGNNKLHLHSLDFPDAPKHVLQNMEIRGRDSIATQVFHSGKPWIGNIQNFNKSKDPASAAGLRAVCAFPLMRHNRVLGVLGLGRLQETAFEQDEIEFLHQVANQVAIVVENALAYGQILSFSYPPNDKIDWEGETHSTWHFNEIVGKSTALRRVLQQVEAVAPANTTVLICGETGTGKELVARAIHNLSLRKRQSFIKVNSAALPAGLLESELFGHEKGAFTGALVQRLGRFELANEGTIFLDEIGELPLELQPKLLRVLQDGEFERVGSSRTCRTNARLVTATNRNLATMVDENRFRADLFYRLNVFPLYLPPLRERQEDIPLLVQHFTKHFAHNLNKTIDSVSSDTMNALVRYPWPGNIRELQNVLERAVILSPGPTLCISPSELKQSGGNGRMHHPLATLEEAERNHILSVLERTNWVLGGPSGAAACLGMKRSTLQLRLHKLGITRPTRT